jgi:hypothetical protein
MATKRMFSKTITNSSRFLMMPQSSQNLYFHLGMNADDDGFCEHFAIMRMTDSKPDDLKILQSKQFINIFDEKVLVILDWKENNYLRSDRYSPSKYLEIYKAELKVLESGIPMVDNGYTQDRIGKDRIGKDILTETSSESISSPKEELPFNLQDTLTIWHTGENKVFRLLAHFIERRNIRIDNKEQLTQIKDRNIKVATKIIKGEYGKEAVEAAIDKILSEVEKKPYDWSLDTVYRKLTNRTN